MHLPAGTLHCFRFNEGGGQMISMTSCEAASALFEHIDREISPVAPDLPRLLAIAGEHQAQMVV